MREKQTLAKLAANPGQWFIVDVSLRNDFALSWLSAHPNAVFEIGHRYYVELGREVTDQFKDRELRDCGCRPLATDPDPSSHFAGGVSCIGRAKVFVLWASVVKNNGYTQSQTSSRGKKYANEVHVFSGRIYSEAKKRHPEILDEDIKKSTAWLDALTVLRANETDARITEMLDFVFGSTARQVMPDGFWSNVITHAPGFVNNFKKIADAKLTSQAIRKNRVNSNPKPSRGLERSKI